MQVSRDWVPPVGTLGRILEETRRRLPSLEGETGPGASPRPATRVVGRPSLKEALRRDTVAVIAEIKRRSPSKGELNGAIDALGQGLAFERGGAAAISVLTEPVFFGGSVQDLIDVASATRVPVLKKDFHVDRTQIAEAIRSSASALLLIARALPPHQLAEMIEVAQYHAIDAVVEVRTDAELECALDAGATIVGVNSRDLETLEVDERVPERLMPRIPPDVIGIWESGVRGVDDVWRAAAAGADAVLVGSALSQSPDPENLVRSMTHVPRRPRRG